MSCIGENLRAAGDGAATAVDSAAAAAGAAFMRRGAEGSLFSRLCCAVTVLRSRRLSGVFLAFGRGEAARAAPRAPPPRQLCSLGLTPAQLASLIAAAVSCGT